MNYKVLYRKYRPDSFDTLVGQKPIVDILKNSIKEGKIAHAYMFSGPRGTGKTSTARILAKAINCLNNEDGIACGKCVNCLNFNDSPDIIEIDAASNNGVNDIRELINNIKIMPTSLKYKIYIIDEVHMLSESAFNALLLTLEEPPEHAIFILATTNLERVPITILSRCQKYDFKRISLTDIVNHLKVICEKENIKYTDEALSEIATLAEGGLRDALSILDQLSKIDKDITLDLVIKEIGTISNKKINDLVNALGNRKIDEVVGFINEFRNINLNYKVVIKKIIDVLANNAVDVLKNGSKNNLDYDDYKNLILELNDIINKIDISIDPYILIEMIMLKYVDNSEKKLNNFEKVIIPAKKSEESILPKEKNISQEIFLDKEIKNEDKITKNISQEINFHPETSVDDKKVNLRINNCFTSASKDELNNVKEKWLKFFEEAPTNIKGLITDTSPVASSKDYVILETTIKHKDIELNKQLKLIENSYNTLFSNEQKLIFLDSDKWLNEKNKYIVNLKKGYKYTLMNEEELEKSNVNNNFNKENIEEIANNIFNHDKIELQ